VRYNQGLAKGLEEGAHANSVKVARNLKAIGMPVRQLSQVTELPEEEDGGL